MVSLSPIAQTSHAQSPVTQCWEDSSTPPQGGSDRAADSINIDGDWICITGTRTDDAGAQQIYTRWDSLDSGQCPGPPPGFAEELLWAHPADGESAAKRLTWSMDGGARHIAWVGGTKTKDANPQEWSAVILPYLKTIDGGWETPIASQVYTFGEGIAGNHEVVAIDGMGSGLWDGGGGLVLAAIRSGAAFSGATSTLVVLRGTMDGTNPMVVSVVMSVPLDFEVRDVRIEDRMVGSEQYIRFWAVGHKMGIPATGRVFAIDFDDDVIEQAYVVSSMHTTPDRFVLMSWPDPGDEPDLFITGSAIPAAISPVHDPNARSRMLVSRFGNMSGSYGFRWHELYEGDWHAVGHDIGVAQAQLDGNGPTPLSDVIYVAGSSERRISTSPDVFSNDFTVWCIGMTPPLWEPELRWEAQLRKDDGDDRAFRLLIDEFKAEALVTGVVENASGHWDWATAKYDRTPEDPVLGKEPVWQIHYPLNSVGNDAPVGISTYITSGYDFFYVGGTSVGAQGDRITMVNYSQQQ